ncbi:hypothetical protein HF325_005656 [Metschnikowia pulcherrima]|uniref:NADPH--cytochrome P450 reductase n=1 Tax=Metschnikowia pulcherrima TaxID=27326 RepID=A0A8H7GMR4_9ASCO|nr:hypothetical protein HF325_005656 [Metschnikowia pulcherrima]
MLDNLDFIVLSVLALAVAYVFGKKSIFSTKRAKTAKFTVDTGERNLTAKLSENDKNCVVFYGSQTGTAEDYAHKLARELQTSFNLKVLTANFADYDYDTLQDLGPDCLLFFVVATYGEGEPPDGAIEFFNWLEHEAGPLRNLKFTVFGLGNSTYEYYNKVSKDLNQKLELLGAQRFAPFGQGDDGTGTIDEDFLAWKDQCFRSLRENLDLKSQGSSYEPMFELQNEPFFRPSHESVPNGEANQPGAYMTAPKGTTNGPFSNENPFLAEIKTTKELFNSIERSCVHAEFDLSFSDITYETGDHVAIWPSNSNEDVDQFMECFGLDEKKSHVFTLKPIDPTISTPLYTPTTYEVAVRHHMEISGPFSRQILALFAEFAPSEESKRKALDLGSNKAAFAEEIHEKKLNLADALLKISKDVPWAKVPFVFLIEQVPHLQPRESRTVHVTAVVEAETFDNHLVTGVTTNLLKEIEITQNGRKDEKNATYDLTGPKGEYANFKLPVHIRKSLFRLPPDPAIPIILIGPGTGIAPMRAFVRERAALIEKKGFSCVGKILFFYGCRRENEDFLYREEWPEYARALGHAFEMEVAFSREGQKKVYVQDKIISRARAVNRLLEEGAYVYVCGDASKMARDVQKTLATVISQERSISMSEASDIVRCLKEARRYQEDVW